MMLRVLTFFSRLVFVLFLLLSAIYCVLAYVPFTYQQIIVAAPMGWLVSLAKFHQWIYWLTLAIAAPSVVGDLRRAETKKMALSFFAMAGALGILLVVHPVLSHIANTVTALYWGLLFLTPLLFLGIVDWLACGKQVAWARLPQNENDRVFRAAWQSALFVSVVYTALAFYMHSSKAAAGGAEVEPQLIGTMWSLVSHLTVFMLLFAGTLGLRLLARRSEQSSRVDFILSTVAAAAGLALIVRFLVTPVISFQGAWATIFSAAIGVSIAIAWAGLCVRLFAGEQDIDSGLGLLLRQLAWRRILPGGFGFAIFAVILVLAWLLAVRSSSFDWNFLKQKLAALFIWAITFANFYDLSPRKEEAPASALRRLIFATAVIVPLIAFGVMRSVQQRSTVQIAGSPVRIDQILDQYSGYNASFKMLLDGLGRSESAPNFYKFLEANTNIDVSVPSASVDLKLVDQMVPAQGPKPNIFIIVIDSLRRDYVGAYNPAVTFTPNLDAFARESVTFTNAFTRYGGTGLSEPAIWSGAMLLHKQYPNPFYPMNSLQKLIDTDSYRTYVAWDPILDLTVKHSDAIVPLDSDIPGRRFDFCKSMQSLEDELTISKSAAAGGTFVFLQAQNIHTWVVNNEGNSVPPGESYPGFYDPVAARIHYMDQCLGKFDKFMKQSGLYDNSIVVLTSDHGEMLGEEGRWGHGYAMVEDIARIPLIMHVPQSIRSRMYVNPDAPAFQIDITPTLYYLLGHRPIRHDDLFGKPLFTETKEEAAQYEQPSYLLVSSYTPVYAILQGDGRTLFVANASDQREYLFDLSPNSKAAEKTLTPELTSHYESLIESDVKKIAIFYSFTASR